MNKPINWTKERWLMATEMLCLGTVKRQLNLADLARIIGKSPTNPVYHDFVNRLIDYGAIEEGENIGSSRMVKVNNKELLRLMVHNELWASFERVVAVKNAFWGIWKI